MTGVSAGRRAVLAAGLGIGLAGVHGGAGAAGALRGVVREAVDAVLATPGPVGVIARADTPRGAAVARAGSALLAGGPPVPWRSRLRVGSVTKPFVATVVLQLVGEGRLSLADPVERWLPGMVRGEGNDGRAITIRQLLQHTSGLFDFIVDVEALPQTLSAEAFEARRFHRYAPQELVAIALRHPPLFAPGTAFSYCNTGYVLLGMVIERVTGRGWQVEAGERLIGPCGLRDTLVPVDDPGIPGPHPHLYRSFADADAPLDVTVHHQSIAWACGSLVSSLADVTRFYRLLRGGALLGPAQLAEMHRTVPTAGDVGDAWPGSRYGLGWMWIPTSQGGGYWTHNGDTFGCHTRAGISPDGRSSFVLAWSGDGQAAADVAVTALAERVMGVGS